MNTNDKTLADVQPGGRVRLGDRQFEAWALSTGRTINDLRKLEGEYVYEDTRLMCAAWQAALSAQPSPGGQGDDSPMAKMAAALRGKAEAERAAFDQRVQSGEWGPMPDNPDVLELPPLPEEVDSVRCMIRGEKGFAEPCDYYFTSKQMRDYARTALAASQPSKQPDSVALGEATEFCIEKGDRRPAHGSGTLVDSGALQMALNVLRRAGKDEVADALEATAARQPVEFDDKELQFYREHIGNDLDNMLIDAGVFEVTHEGGYKACWANSMDALERLIDRQPVGEPVGYFDPDVLAHLTEGLIDPVGVLRRKPNGKSNVPVWLGSPAQAVDLGQFRPAVELMEWQERGHANPDFPVGDPKKHAEALRLLALIDSQAVGNG